MPTHPTGPTGPTAPSKPSHVFDRTAEWNGLAAFVGLGGSAPVLLLGLEELYR